jgi:hypothetical protein
MATVLDSHPQISCGAELLPPPMPKPSTLLDLLNEGVMLASGDFSQAGQMLKYAGRGPAGVYYKRCFRAGIREDEVRSVLGSLQQESDLPIQNLFQRVDLAQRLMERRSARENTQIYGFKYASAATQDILSYFPNAYFVGIVRDPFDVVLSHQKQNFQKTVQEICRAWTIYSQKYREFCDANPERAICIRYEDLVAAPRRWLQNVFDILPVRLHEKVFDFYRSDSPIHSGYHPNADRLKMNFNADAVGKGRVKLPVQDAKLVETECASEMAAFGYTSPGYVKMPVKGRMADEIVKIGSAERAAKQAFFGRKRKYKVEDYERLVLPYLETHESINLVQFAREESVGDRKILIIRHDVDHDIETAVKIARWEKDHGILATYCILHTAWYYGRLEDGRYRHSDLLLDSLRQIRDLGHEINFHNNLVTLALSEGADPTEILRQELAFYDSMGIPVTGTSTHGDALCRELNFRNWEIFSECCDSKFGGLRTLLPPEGSRGRSVDLGAVSMYDFGLEYEAYDIERDIYHTDSGGNLRMRQNAPGRRPFGREKGRGETVAVLTHPIWWDFP